ncbi:hypothetical protein EDD86DRAFT_244027 [Gorgonomyces haynaldii]|nr:hypothetical protein EDD86DRAFT_244027 [Gorgonomyces haynaldii]
MDSWFLLPLVLPWIYYLYRLKKSDGTGLKLYLAQTVHCRFHPKFHSFKYPLFYVGLSLGQSLPWFMSFNKWNILSIRESDYLDDKPGLILNKLTHHLKQLGLETPIASVELLTTPRFFGYAFNPLSVYLLKFKDQDRFSACLLEVNNTFKEKHLYLCFDKTEIDTKQGYDKSYRIERSFHVSPFNNRSGVYEAHVMADGVNLDVLLNIFDYTDTTSKPTDLERRLLLTARVSGDAKTLDTAALVYLLTFFPLNCMLTVPRIMYEASRLSFAKKLPVYPRPNPGTKGDGATVVTRNPSSFQHLCLQMLKAHLSEACESKNKSLIIETPLERLEFGAQPAKDVIKIHNWQFFVRMITSDNLVNAFYVSFVKGDVTCDQHAVQTLVLLLSNNQSVKSQLKQHHLVNTVGSHISRPYSWQLAWGRLSEHFEKQAFKWTTHFVPGTEPFLLEERCEKYLQVESSNWDGVAVLDDKMGPQKIEETRAGFFLQAIQDFTQTLRQ